MPNIIELNNSEKIKILDAKPTEFSIKQPAEEIIEIFNKLTIENLQTIKYLIDEYVVQILINKCIEKVSYENGVATYYLKDVDIIEQRLRALEDTVDTLVLGDLLESEEE